MAREALSNGDKILSENYLQHADHFTRILNDRDNFKRDKFSDSSSENSTNVVEENNLNAEQNSTKDLTETTSDETKKQKNVKSQVEII